MVNAYSAIIRPISSTEDYTLSITDAMTESSGTSSTERAILTAITACNCFQRSCNRLFPSIVVQIAIPLYFLHRQTNNLTLFV